MKCLSSLATKGVNAYLTHVKLETTQNVIEVLSLNSHLSVAMPAEIISANRDNASAHCVPRSSEAVLSHHIRTPSGWELIAQLVIMAL